MAELYKQVYKGIEFIRISKLPPVQKAEFLNWLPEEKVIKILCDDELLKDCVQLKEYEYWIRNIFKPDSESQEIISGEPVLKPSLKHSH